MMQVTSDHVEYGISFADVPDGHIFQVKADRPLYGLRINSIQWMWFNNPSNTSIHERSAFTYDIIRIFNKVTLG
jgi:hypothetical protein